jgi:hypothetical protein
MAADLDQLNAMIARLRGIPDLVKSALPECAAECKAIIAENVAAQRGPDGAAWQPGAKGQPILKDAAGAVSAQAIGNAIVISLSGINAKHHLGAVRGGIARPIIPTRKAPQAMTKAIERVLVRRLQAGK